MRHGVNNFYSVIFIPYSYSLVPSGLFLLVRGRAAAPRGGSAVTPPPLQSRGSQQYGARVRACREEAWYGHLASHRSRPGAIPSHQHPRSHGTQSCILGSDCSFLGAFAASAWQKVIFGLVQWEECRDAVTVSVRAIMQVKIFQRSTSTWWKVNIFKSLNTSLHRGFKHSLSSIFPVNNSTNSRKQMGTW